MGATPEVAAQIPNLLILFTVTLVCVVMNLGGMEVAANVDLDWNREFRVTGWANAVTGAGGALPGCLIATTSIRNVLFGATTGSRVSSPRWRSPRSRRSAMRSCLLDLYKHVFTTEAGSALDASA